jgi:hypothetical protein
MHEIVVKFIQGAGTALLTPTEKVLPCTVVSSVMRYSKSGLPPYPEMVFLNF